MAIIGRMGMDKKALFVRPFNFCSEIMLGNFRLISRNSALSRNGKEQS